MTEGTGSSMSREDLMAALFGNMVLQQTNMALMFLGKVPHPESGERVHDLEMAQMFIDQLEMLEAKTRNNLSKQEEALLKQSLMAVRMAFVEETNKGGKPSAEKAPVPETQAQPQQAPTESEQTEETRKKFTKKY